MNITDSRFCFFYVCGFINFNEIWIDYCIYTRCIFSVVLIHLCIFNFNLYNDDNNPITVLNLVTLLQVSAALPISSSTC